MVFFAIAFHISPISSQNKDIEVEVLDFSEDTLQPAPRVVLPVEDQQQPKKWPTTVGWSLLAGGAGIMLGGFYFLEEYQSKKDYSGGSGVFEFFGAIVCIPIGIGMSGTGMIMMGVNNRPRK